MALTPVAYSGSNSYVPSFETTGLVIDFTRNPNRFPLNTYAAFKKVNKSVGYYLLIDPDQAARVQSVQQFVWPEGNDAKDADGNWNTEQFNFLAYRTVRYKYPWALDFKLTEQAAWNLLAEESAQKAQQAMTNRTLRVINALSNYSWAASQTSAANTLNGGAGFWSTASSASGSANFLAIQKAIQAAVLQIAQNTNSVVQIGDLKLLISPSTALSMAQSDEMHSYLRSSPDSLMTLEGRQFAATWGLPKYYAGIEIVVENSIQVTSGKGQARATNFIMNNNSAFILSRPDGLAGDGVSTSYSTVTVFEYEPFTVETMTDINNRRYLGRVVEDTAEIVTAPAAGYYITHLFS